MDSYFTLIFAFLSLMSGRVLTHDIQSTVKISSGAVGVVLDQYASVDIDWWHNTSGSGGAWGNASVLYLDLQNKRLRNLVASLAPAFLRIGGSQDNIVKYLVGNMTESECNAPSIFRGQPVSQCLTGKRWKEVLDFVSDTELDLVFGTSFFTSADGSWDAANVLSLLNFTASTGNSFYGLELGEEMEPESCIQNPADCPLVKGYRQLRNAVHKIWPSNPPLIMGPADGMTIEKKTNPFMQAFLKQTLGEGTLDVVVMHSYNNDGGDGWKRPGLLKQTLVQAKDMLEMTRKWTQKGKTPRLWCGECGPHNQGGVVNVTDRAMSSFWYLDALGGLARLGLQQHGRQALVGSHYGLLEDGSYLPNPDYFTLLSWKRLMGRVVLDTDVTAAGATDDIRVYAHCSRDRAGVVTVAFVNVSPSQSHEFNFQIGGHTGHYRREEYLFTPPKGDLLSKTIELNGEVLALIGDELPTMRPVIVDGGEPLKVPPLSFGFAVLSDAMHPACMTEITV